MNSRKIAQLEQRIRRLERSASRQLTASEKSWIFQKLEDFKNWILGKRKKTRDSASSMKEAFLEEGITNPQEVSKWIERAKTPRTLLEKEVKQELDRKHTFKAKVEYLSEMWEDRFEGTMGRRDLKRRRASVATTFDAITAAIVFGLIYTVAGFTGVLAIGLGIAKIILSGIVLLYVFGTLGVWDKLTSLFVSKAKPTDLKKLGSMRAPHLA
jgi:hypothetical protein